MPVIPRRHPQRLRAMAGAGAGSSASRQGSSAALVVAIAGQTISPLRRLSLLSPRRPDTGPQGFPVNRSSAEAGVAEAAMASSDYRLRVERGGQEEAAFSLDELAAMEMRTAELPIACVEGWSASRPWTGVPVRALLAAPGITGSTEVEVVSLQRDGRYSRSVLNRHYVNDDNTLLALAAGGEALHLEHGFPVRLIAVGAASAVGDSKDAHPLALLVHIVAFDIGHDVIVAPIAILAGWALVRVVPRSVRGPVIAGVVVSAFFVAFSVPLVRRWGVRPSNPSALPLNYRRNLLIVLAIVWLVTAAAVTVRLVREAPPSPSPPA